MPELKETFPGAAYILRPGQINAWDNDDFVNAVKKTGRKQVIIAGGVTEVCVAFPALPPLKLETRSLWFATGTTTSKAWKRFSVTAFQTTGT